MGRFVRSTSRGGFGLRAAVALTIGLAVVSVAGCASSEPVPTSSIDSSLVPTTPPEGVLDVSAPEYDDGFGEFIFRVGQGPTWCSMTPAMDGQVAFATCEHDEASVNYKPVPAPNSCSASYGYQIRLWGGSAPVAAGSGKQAQFTCASSAYSDPTSAKILPSGSRLSVDDLSCWVSDFTARCDNKNGNYIVLGPSVWALG